MTRSRMQHATFLVLGILGCAPQKVPEQEAIEQSALANAQIDFVDSFKPVVKVQNRRGGVCTGSAISKNRVLTAAHCVCEDQQADGASVQKSGACDSRAEVTFEKFFGLPTTRKATVSVHPSFCVVKDAQGGDLFNRADIAVLELERPEPTWSGTFSLDGAHVDAGESLTLVGFGRTACGAQQGEGLRRGGRSTSLDLADSRYPDLFFTGRDVSAASGAIALPGDSGGPALVANQSVGGVLSIFSCQTVVPLHGHPFTAGQNGYTRLDFRDQRTQSTYAAWIAGCASTTGCSMPKEEPADCSLACPPCALKETCNLADDNNDGQIDEGLPWSASPAKAIFPVSQYAVYLRAITLMDGRVALVGGDSAGGGNDRGFVAMTDAQGNLLLGPTWTRIPTRGVSLSSIAEGPNGEIGALYSTTDYTSTCSNCPVVFSRINGATGELVHWTALPLSFRPRDAQGLALTASGYASLIRDADTSNLHIVWFDPQTGTIVDDRELPGGGVGSASLALGEADLGWVRALSNPAGRIDFGVTPADAASMTIGGPITLADDGVGIFSDGGGRGLIRAGNDFVAAFTAIAGTGSEPRIARLSGASIQAGPVPTGPSDFDAKDVALVGGSPVAVTISRTSPAEIRLRRFRGDLTPLVPAVNDVEVPTDSAYVTAVATTSAVLVFKAEPTLGGAVDVVRVGCP